MRIAAVELEGLNPALVLTAEVDVVVSEERQPGLEPGPNGDRGRDFNSRPKYYRDDRCSELRVAWAAPVKFRAGRQSGVPNARSRRQKSSIIGTDDAKMMLTGMRVVRALVTVSYHLSQYLGRKARPSRQLRSGCVSVSSFSSSQGDGTNGARCVKLTAEQHRMTDRV